MCGTGKPTAELAEPPAAARMSVNSSKTRVLDQSLVSLWRDRQRDSNRFAFKKTCPFEFTRHVWRIADTKAWPSVLPSLVSQCEYQKGKYRFSGEGLGLAPTEPRNLVRRGVSHRQSNFRKRTTFHPSNPFHVFKLAQRHQNARQVHTISHLNGEVQ